MPRLPAQPATEPSGAARVAAALVHAYTAAGAVLAYLAVTAAVARDFRASFACMFAANIIDATDGLFARHARVREVLPAVDGARLDDIVDYLTFVFVPMVVLNVAGDLSGPSALPVTAAVLLSSGYGFAATDAKTSDHFFTGFPSYWNMILLVFSALIFVRVGYVYPSKMPTLRGLTVALGCVWGAMIGVMIWSLPAVSRALLVASLFFPAYYAVLSLALDARRRAGLVSPRGQQSPRR
ncbi:MAG: CDP-diacylglycerol O-phosphatidyltransferase [Acidobacteria bacterium]|nr:MAG: CDP-diacylglycerol O-phosphatidyltransferase [Acidobacteriota bacterium]